jgi:hypothetical protein
VELAKEDGRRTGVRRSGNSCLRDSTIRQESDHTDLIE